MIHARKGKIVLYQPQQVDSSIGPRSSGDMIPLEMLQIAAWPDREGYEIVIIDGSLYPQAEAHRLAVEAAQDAMLFGVTGILGFMVKDGYQCVQRLRAVNKRIKVVAGGWFASVRPDLLLKTGLYDGVVMGQGEQAFREIVEATAAGEAWDDLKSVAVWKDGDVYKNEKHPVVGFDQVLDPAWHLLDFEPYRALQLDPDSHKHILRMPSPERFGKRKPYVGITFFSSFGCPEPCKFCCSPFVTNRRWKAMTGARIVDNLEHLKERWGYDVVRFHDANFGVLEKRVKEFTSELLERELDINWNCFIETNSILRYDPSTLDAMAASGMHLAEIGAETGTDEFMKEQIGKPISGDDNVNATYEMERRGIECSVTYIIGYPKEDKNNMLATLDQARRAQAVAPKSSITVWPYRPIPGTEMWDQAIELGFTAPDELEHWGSLGEYHLHETWPGRIPPEVAKVRKLYCHYQTLARGLVRKKVGLWEKLARWRLQSGNYKFGEVEAKLFDVFIRVYKKVSKDEGLSRSWVDPGHKTGTSGNENAAKIDQREVVSSVTTGDYVGSGSER
ncbi:B12-binding domain-containing radical SAM protein [Engelhardtia mirabilis]|uniref:Radical SAM superfamily protein n=1 Tax=Engelhardtia mirabilis TaxID=2528011 RepID=A0A518BQF2_9BACT|nr:Radical SAM superfamily protein [Planctomycetes bacterium Pla133]QDV03534.1 Radical SAM superfamily protein [Planctomycetes bacterium Pla86]